MRHILLITAISSLVLTGACKTTEESGTAAPAASASSQAAAVNAENSRPDGVIQLAAEDAPKLIGVWEGPYRLDSGNIGRGILTVTETSGGTVQAFFEYRWRGSNYDRHPDDGTVRGRIGDDGKLHFGSWDLTLDKDGSEYTFKTRQRFAGSTANLTWSRSDLAL